MIGQINMFDLTMPMISIENKIRLIELFAGYGSQSMALDEMGVNYEHYKVVEFDKYAIQSYNAVHGTCFEPSDIRDIRGNDLEILYTDLFTYLLTYSFPCTDLSVAGKMQGMSKGSGTRSGLLWEVERLLTEIHEDRGELPQILFMENVPQVLSSANIKDFHAWQDFLTSLGYTNHVQILNAKDYGVAQNRERAFMFSFLGEYNYKFPEPIPLTKTIKDYLELEVNEKYYLSQEACAKLLRNSKIEEADIEGLCKLNKPYKSDKTGFTSMDDAGLCDFKQEISSTVTSRYCKGIGSHKDNVILETVRIKQATKDGYIDCKIGGVADLSFPTSKTRRGRVQDGGDTCPTITAGETEIYRIEKIIQLPRGNNKGGLHEISPTVTSNSFQENNFLAETIYRIRKLTERECGRLMCVSDENISRMKKVNSNSQLYKQFGNSIVVLCMIAMFSNLNIQGLPRWSEIKDRY